MMKKLLIQIKGKQEEVTMIFKTLVIRTCFLLACSILLPTAVALSQDYCEGNFDYDQDQDGGDAFTFKTDFGRSQFSNPCPPDGPAPVAKTGQTTCYDDANNQINCAGTGQDGEYQKGVALPNPRFTDNNNGTVTDNLTGLIWLKDANCFETRTWAQALSDCNGLNSGECGLTDGSAAGDWRLPNSYELASLVHKAYYSPAVPNTAGTGKWTEGDPFTNVQSSDYCYWSSTTWASNSNSAWCVNMYNGVLYHGFLNKQFNSQYIWPVRGGQ